MANNPVFGISVCPHCGSKVPVIWNGNFKMTCIYCGRKFHVKRQKLKKTQPLPRRAGDGRWVPETVKRENPLSPHEEYVFDTMICSGRGAGFDVSEAMNFCPNCGADMREEVQNAGD